MENWVVTRRPNRDLPRIVINSVQDWSFPPSKYQSTWLESRWDLNRTKDHLRSLWNASLCWRLSQSYPNCFPSFVHALQLERWHNFSHFFHPFVSLPSFLPSSKCVRPFLSPEMGNSFCLLACACLLLSLLACRDPFCHLVGVACYHASPESSKVALSSFGPHRVFIRLKIFCQIVIRF